MSRKQHTAAADIGTSEFCPTERNTKQKRCTSHEYAFVRSPEAPTPAAESVNEPWTYSNTCAPQQGVPYSQRTLIYTSVNSK